MTSTPVKDVGSVLTNLAASQTGRSTSGTGEFQKVWSSQMNKGTQSFSADGFGSEESVQSNVSKTSESQGTDRSQGNDTTNGSVKEQGVSEGQEESKVSDAVEGTDTAESKDTDVQAPGGDSDAPTETVDSVEEMSPEELEQVMAVLGTASVELIQKIADAFGITVDEVQAVMDELGMVQTDVLNEKALGNLLLTLGGAEDSYALIMDESLYGNYRMLMEQLQNVLKECSGELLLEPEQLTAFLEKQPESGTAVEESALIIETPKFQDGQRGEEPVEAVDGAEAEMPLQDRTVQNVQAQTEGQTGEQPGQTKAEHRSAVEKPEEDSAPGAQSKQFHFGQLQADEFSPEAVRTESAAQTGGWSAETRNIMSQIMDYMKLQLNEDSNSLEMQLHPASLGTLQVQIATKGGMLTAHFITQNEAVKAAIEGQIVQLRETFEEQGVKVEAIEVTVQTHEFEQNLEQGRGRDSQETDKKNRTRKLRLEEPAAVEDVDEEDALQAEMMAARGSTVSYTA